MPDAYSIRESLQGALQDFIRASGFNCVRTEEIVRELVSLLAAYREEDLPLFPEVFVLANPDGLKVLAPSSEQITLGIADLTHHAAEVVLKRCASLAFDGWAVFVVKQDADKLRYGLFRANRYAFATGAEEAMGDLGLAVPVLLVRNRGHLVVELRNTKNERFTATLKSVTATPSPLGEHVANFVTAASSGVADPPQFQPYLRRLLTEMLQRSHGTLLAVIDPPENPEAVHETLKDGVWLTPPITLAGRHSAALAKHDADGLANLQAAQILLTGMINSDGVVVLGKDGTVLAYRVFLKPNADERDRLPDSGGGRRRTYELMRLRVGTVFKAAFFRSQDGETACQRHEQ